MKACLSPDGKYIISGSNDQTAYIWSTKNPGWPILKLPGHVEEVTCSAWCNIGDSKVFNPFRIFYSLTIITFTDSMPYPLRVIILNNTLAMLCIHFFFSML